MANVTAEVALPTEGLVLLDADGERVVVVVVSVPDIVVDDGCCSAYGSL